MRQLLVIAACLSVSGCDLFYVPRFDIHEIQAWSLCETPEGQKVETYLPTSAEHCGKCGNDCGDGVVCIDGRCHYATRMHCGAAGRTCVGFEGGVDVDCVRVGEGADDPALGPVVRGYACAPVASVPLEAPPTAPIGEGGEDDRAPPELIVGDPPLEPDWILVPGRSTNCRTRVDGRCYFAEVELRDACDAACTVRIEHDFELMTTEMSRAMYRDAVLGCACEGVEPPLCAELCADDGEAEARPITGLSWCEAYEACQAVGGRLPTLVERARVEALVDVDPGLFTRLDVCDDWVAEVGTSPRVAQCAEQPETLGLDRVDGWDGAVPIGTAVLPAPRYFHHLFGNVDEWLADPLDGATCAALTQSQPWGVPETLEENRRLRLTRGRSLFSPAGETGDRTLALSPGAQAAELGVRCARTSVDTAPTPTPYAATIPARDHARCDTAAVGERAVRDALGDLVYRATRTCVDWRTAPTEMSGQAIEELLGRALAGDPVALARHPLNYEGGPFEVGQALFAADEQWWLGPSARAPGDPLTIQSGPRAFDVVWGGEYDAFGSECADVLERDASGARTAGQKIIGQVLRVDARTLAALVGPGQRAGIREFACQHLTCADDVAGACEEACATWDLPVVVEFQRVRVADRYYLCGPANP